MATHIQIGNVEPRVQYAADGTQTTFSYPFPIFTSQDLSVYINDAKVNTGFTVTGAGTTQGGTVTFDVAPDNGSTITIYRYLNIERTSDFLQSGELRSKVLNDELDYMTAVMQQLSDEQSRCARLPITDVSAAGVYLAEPSANKVIAWSSTGDGFQNGPDISEVANAQTYALNAQTSEANAASSEAAAAASAAMAQASAGSGPYTTVTILTAGMHDIEIANSRTYYVLDVSGGAVIVNLPLIGSDEGVTYGFQQSGSANTATIVREGSDFINGVATDYVLSADTEVVQFIADDNTPDNWIANVQSQTIAGNGTYKSGSKINLNDQVIFFACSSEYGAISAGSGVVELYFPVDFMLTGLGASLTTAQTSGSVVTVDINTDASSLLSTKITLDNGEKTSTSASVPPVLASSHIPAGSTITVDIDQVGDGTATGLKVWMKGYAS